MEIKDCRRDVFADLSKLQQQFQNLHEEVECLRTSKVIVDCVECVHCVSCVLNQKLLKTLGKSLQHIDDIEKRFLLSGPFEMWKDKKRMCCTYFDLLHYHDKKPCAKVDEYLRTVEHKAVKIFRKIDGHSPQRTIAIRMMFRSFIANGKALRNVESHIGMVKDQETKGMILRRIERYGKVTLKKFGLGDLFPLVSVGIFVLRHGEIEDGSDDDGHHSVPSTSSVNMLISEPVLSVRVTFLVKKKVPLLHVVGLFGNLQRLGNNDPNKALHMACKDDLSWENIVVIPCDAALMFSFVVLKKTIGKKKWTLVEGPTNPFEACVGATPTMLLQCDW